MVPSAIRHLRPVRPVDFPATDPDWEMGETIKHQTLRDVVKESLRFATAGEPASVGSDQFLYFDPRDGRRKCAPDAFLKLGVAQTPFDTWKTWEKGTPELCVEIVSPSDHEKLTLEEKIERFHAMGIAEVIAFDPDARAGRRLRAWDFVSGDLVERVVEREATPCLTLGMWFVVRPLSIDGTTRLALRLARDAEGRGIVPTVAERERAAEAAKDEALAAKAEAQAAKAEAVAREEAAQAAKAEVLAEVARLRAELARSTTSRPRRGRRR